MLSKKRYNSYELDQATIEEERELLTLIEKQLREDREKKFENLPKDIRKAFGRRHPVGAIKRYLQNFDLLHKYNQKNETIDETTTLENQIETIKKELIQLYQFSENNFDQQIQQFQKNKRVEFIYKINNEVRKFTSRRGYFLIWQYKRLNEILETKRNKKSKILEKLERVFEFFKIPFDILKKPFDSIDDIWSAIQQHLSPTVKAITPTIMGTVLGPLHFVEASNGAWIIFKTLNEEKYKKDENWLRRVANIITGGLTAIVGYTGVAIAKMAIQLKSFAYAVMLAGLMNIIFFLAGWRRGIRYFLGDEKSKNVRYEITEVKNQNGQIIVIDRKKRRVDEIMKIENKLKETQRNIEDLQIKPTQPLNTLGKTLEEKKELKEEKALEEKEALEEKKVLEDALSEGRCKFHQDLNYIKGVEKETSAKRFDFIMSGFEWTASFFVSVGVVVSSGALAGLGVALGFVGKLTEYLDEKYNILRPVKKWFSRLTKTEKKKPEKRPDIPSKLMEKWCSSNDLINKAMNNPPSSPSSPSQDGELVAYKYNSESTSPQVNKEASSLSERNGELTVVSKSPQATPIPSPSKKNGELIELSEESLSFSPRI